ncbi:MAG: aspartate aminotransferase family protein [Pacificimonas sp.]|jgi:acetylornithine/N-succinyldiaminopimelate aminotransferase|nr:aspartate aminotransferase family protein [Pacificimonas sp.]
MLDRRTIFPTYKPPALDIVSGSGVTVTASDGREYLDFIAGIAVNSLGHCHPALVGALQRQSEKLWHLSNMFDVSGQRELAARYCDASFADAVFFTNSGAESVECALKAARRFHHANGAEDRIKVIGFEGAFHGRTYASINAAGNPNYLKGFGPALPGYGQVPFADLDALRGAVDDATAAVILEPVQGEGGVRPFTDDQLRAVRRICDDAGALLIFDEVQSGAGRTGKLFAYEWSGVAPDIMALAKGVGGGFPLGLCAATKDVAQHMVVGTHGTTYGGNALAMAVGLAVMDEMQRPGFLDHVNAVAAHLRKGLNGLHAKHGYAVRDVRGKGLLLGLEMTIPNIAVRDFARDNGLIVGVAGGNVVRLAPPLIVSEAQADTAVAILDRAIAAAAS